MSLKIYPVVLELVRRLSPLVRVLRARSSALADQMERALISIPLNTAEGAYSRGRIDRRAFNPRRLRRGKRSLAWKQPRPWGSSGRSTRSLARCFIASLARSCG
jgi:hypothetical protein